MGIVNAHTHLYSGLAPLGMPAPDPEPENFVQILERVWWKLDRALDEDSLRASAELYVAQALHFGTVGLIDHHESPAFIAGSLEVIAEVCQTLGMPAVLTYGATERNRGPQEAAAGLHECKRFIESNTRPMCRGMVGLHASFTVSDETIKNAAALARHLGVGLHVHVAEDMADVDDARERGYPGVIDRLADCGALVAGSIFAHGVHLTAAEIQRCWDAGVWLVQNPRSNKGNKVGYPKNLKTSDRVALGTDGYPADMQAEAEALREEAQAAGDDMEAVDKRPAAGLRLMTELFGEVPAPKAPPGPGHMDDIRSRARTQAELLWERMRAL
jgi:cytosine/adenosine deaminase-related metal-dependent hydrolase